jgi:hypothetical protein
MHVAVFVDVVESSIALARPHVNISYFIQLGNIDNHAAASTHNINRRQ